MRFNPKEAWKSVKIFSGGDTSHHKNPTSMSMQLPNGSTTAMDAENASVIGPHFAKVFCSDIQIDCYALE